MEQQHREILEGLIGIYADRLKHVSNEEFGKEYDKLLKHLHSVDDFEPELIRFMEEESFTVPINQNTVEHFRHYCVRTNRQELKEILLNLK